MLDIKWIRDNADALDAALAKRGASPLAATLIDLDEKRRSVIQKAQDMQSRRNAASKEIGAAMAAKNSELAEKLKAEVSDIKEQLPAAEEEERRVVEQVIQDGKICFSQLKEVAPFVRKVLLRWLMKALTRYPIFTASTWA